MRRVLSILVGLIVVGGLFALATGRFSKTPAVPKYWAEMDNAFGLVTGGDLKIAGVRAGKVTDISLDRKTNRALVGFTVTQDGFGSLRSDVQCGTRPQSLIGEYYLECDPGTSPNLLVHNSQTNPIPVTQTTSTVPFDLVQDIFRAPYRQRFSLILGELGAGVGGNGENLNAAIRRAIPALSQTDTVLSTLGAQNHVLAHLASKADTVLSALAGNRRDVQRFVVSAGHAAYDTASQKAALEAGFAKLPGFLAELRPAMAALGNVATQTTPALRALSATSGQLKALFNNIGPFANASTPAFAALGRASVIGNQAVTAAAPTVAQLNSFSKGTPELGQNLSIVLRHLDDPAFGAERDVRAIPQHPLTHSDTYTGLEALLQYVFDQSQSINFFNSNGHLLSLATTADPTTCSPYADVAGAKANPQCRAWLGPTQPGITTPDPTRKIGTSSTTTSSSASSTGALPVQLPVTLPVSNRGTSTTSSSSATSGGSSSGTAGGGSSSTAASGTQTCVVGICLPTAVPKVALPAPGGAAPGQSAVATHVPATSSASAGPSAQTKQSLLNYLLGP